MRYLVVSVLGLIVLLLSPFVGGPPRVGGQSATPGASPGAADGEFAGLIDIGGRSLYLDCRGSGGPTVVLEAGYPNNADIWDTIALPPGSAQTAVLPGVASFTHVCAYDRPGTVLDPEHLSRSDPVPQPRTAAALVADLHVLLSKAGVPGPYVLVGHSLGGILVRLYAATYTEEVVGLVLIDASHEEQNTRLRAVLSPEHWAAFDQLTRQVPRGFEEFRALERIDFETSFAQMREMEATQPLGPLPLVVLSHGRPLSADIPVGTLPAGFPWEAIEQESQDLQADLAALVPGARRVIATESGHFIHAEQPNLVIDAIRQVVAAVRDPTA